MANGYFERGEIYKVRMDFGVGCEEGAFRPGLIISSNRINNASGTVIVAYISRKAFNRQKNAWDVEIESTGITSYVMCNQIAVVDKSRLTGLMGQLNSIEQKNVDDALESTIDLGYIDETALKAKDEEIADRDVLIGDLKAELAGAVSEIGKRNEEIASLKMEIEMWQKCYGRCMDMLVDVKVSGDVARRTAVAAPVVPDIPKQPEEPKKPETPPVEESPVEEKRLDINTCTATALKKAGFSLAVARKIVEGRPFKSVEDLKRVNGVKANLLRVLAPKLCCTEVIKPVVNGGIPDPGYEVDDNAETEVVAEIPQNMKVNVNTASAEELHEKLGLSKTVCYSITGTRKRDGLYKSIDELKNAKKFTQKHFEMYRDMLEV